MSPVLVNWCVTHNARFGEWTECDRSDRDAAEKDATCYKALAVVLVVEYAE